MAITPLNPGETWGEQRQKINDNDAELDSRVSANESGKANRAGDTFTGPITIQEDLPQLVFDDTDVVDVDGQSFRIRQEGDALYIQRMLADGSWEPAFQIWETGSGQFSGNITLRGPSTTFLNIKSAGNATGNYFAFVIDAASDIFGFQVRDSAGLHLATSFNINLDPADDSFGRVSFNDNIPTCGVDPTGGTHLARKAYVDAGDAALQAKIDLLESKIEALEARLESAGI